MDWQRVRRLYAELREETGPVAQARSNIATGYMFSLIGLAVGALFVLSHDPPEASAYLIPALPCAYGLLQIGLGVRTIRREGADLREQLERAGFYLVPLSFFFFLLVGLKALSAYLDLPW